MQTCLFPLRTEYCTECVARKELLFVLYIICNRSYIISPHFQACPPELTFFVQGGMRNSEQLWKLGLIAVQTLDFNLQSGCNNFCNCLGHMYTCKKCIMHEECHKYMTKTKLFSQMRTLIIEDKAFTIPIVWYSCIITKSQK